MLPVKLSENKRGAGDGERKEEVKKGGRGEEGNEMRDIRDWPRGDGEKSKASRRKREDCKWGNGNVYRMNVYEKSVTERKENLMIVSMRYSCKNPSEACRDVS